MFEDLPLEIECSFNEVTENPRILKSGSRRSYRLLIANELFWLSPVDEVDSLQRFP
uniref:Uncharacterized protein n=1 Tax=Meloidogyne incognita TaxID=6306 RepID=A0A914LG42_MELIC